MDAKTLKALKASIAKWERNAVAETPADYLTSETDCPLCELFVDNRCERCPVFERTGQPYCEGTPYFRAYEAKQRWCRTLKAGRGTKTVANITHSAARAEVKFLKSLLPKDQSND